MKVFQLETDELAALVGFLNARKLVGMDESLFNAFTEANLPHLVAKLNAHGWLLPGDRPETWHMHEELMQTLAVAVSPHFAVLARSQAQHKSIVFYRADEEIVEIVVTEDGQALVARLESLDELAAHIEAFLRDARPGDIGVARVNSRGDALEAGRQAVADAQGNLTTRTPGLLPSNAWSVGNIAAFLRGAMAELGKP